MSEIQRKCVSAILCMWLSWLHMQDDMGGCRGHSWNNLVVIGVHMIYVYIHCRNTRSECIFHELQAVNAVCYDGHHGCCLVIGHCFWYHDDFSSLSVEMSYRRSLMPLHWYYFDMAFWNNKVTYMLNASL